MIIIRTRKLKIIITILLIIALILSGLFSYPDISLGFTKEVTTTYYRLDTGVTFLWCNSTDVWQYGLAPGETHTGFNDLTIHKNAVNLEISPYDENTGYNSTGYFPFSPADKIPSSNIIWNKTKLARDKKSYDEYYNNFSAHLTSVGGKDSYDQATGNITVTYNVTFNAKGGSVYNVKDKLSIGKKQDIIDLLGSPSQEIIDAMNLMDPSSEVYNPNVEGYLYFIPIVLRYDVTEIIELGEIDAKLSLPSSAKQGESYTVADSSVVSEQLTIDTAVLEKHYGDENWQTVDTWYGTEKGVDTGGSISETENEITTVTYRLTVTADNGLTDTDIKTIDITDNRKIEGTAILELPEYSYEGHPALAEDLSEFKVDGIDYSARRAYEEGVAANQFIPLPSGSGRTDRESLISANVVFNKKGDYNVKLEIDTATGDSLSDTKPVTIRKTPYIIDRLGGVQKQNRKQLLNISVATYPGKPVTNYYIELEDLKTGQKILLTKNQPQSNNSTIKTRPYTTSGNEYWSNFDLEFLTKNNLRQDYRYTIFMEDSKGDTDIVQKTFSVEPDLPPNPVIQIQDTFIRNKGTNIAEIIAEDISTTDGDQLERKWSTKGTNIRDMDGYKDLSFGSGQKIQYDKTGVGKAEIKLEVKDIWIEPTMEEYITEEDRLSSYITGETDVVNIAPTVSLEPVNTEKVDIAILTGKASKSGIESGINQIKAALIEAGIDANVQVLPVAKANNDGYRRVGYFEWPVSVNCQTCRTTGLVFDSDYAYKVESAGRTVSGYQEICTHPHTIYAIKPGEPLAGEKTGTVWSYTVNESNYFSIKLDNQEKYLYILCSDLNKTVVLNRNNGAYVTTLNVLLPGTPITTSTNENLYFLSDDKIQKYDSDSGTIKTVINKGGIPGRIEEGKITFIGYESNNRFYIGKFDMNTEQLEGVPLPELPNGPITGFNKTSIYPTDMDSTGKVTFTQTFYDAYLDTRGSSIWLADSKTQKVYLIENAASTYDMQFNSVGFVKNESGEAVYIYHGYGDDDSRISTTRRYCYINLYTLGSEESAPYVIPIYAQMNNRLNWTGISYAKFHSQENAIYLMQGADFGWNGLVQGVQCRIQLPSWSKSFNQYDWGWDVAEEYGASNDSLMATYYSAERWAGMDQRVKLFRNSITKEQAEQSALLNFGNFREDTKRYIERNHSNVEDLITNVRNTLSEKIKALHLFGDGHQNTASISKSISLDKGQKYEYEYDMFLTSGSAVDVFDYLKHKETNPESEGEKTYSKLIAERDFSSPGNVPFFQTGSSYFLNTNYGYSGLGSGYYGRKSESQSYSCWLQVDMEEQGFVEFDFFRVTGCLPAGTYSIVLDGNIMETGNDEKATHMLTFLNKGIHKFEFFGNGSGCIGINNVKASYTYGDDFAFTKADIKGGKPGEKITIRNEFISGRQDAFIKTQSSKGQFYKEDFTRDIVCTKNYNVVTASIAPYIRFQSYRDECPWGFNEVTGTARMESTYYGRATGSFTITAPEDQLLVAKFDESVYAPHIAPANGGSFKKIGLNTVIIPPGETMSRSYTMTRGSEGGFGFVSISNIRIITFEPYDFNLNRLFLDGGIINSSLDAGEADIALIKISDDDFTITEYTNIGGGSFDSSDEITISSSSKQSEVGLNAFISNFKLYRIFGNLKQLLVSEPFNTETHIFDNQTGRAIWKRDIQGNGTAEIKTMDKQEPKEEAPLVYKKGELVSYHIVYDDYEKDPSKKSYWRYIHTPFNDGPHPQAAFILDENGNVITSTGTILSESIPRFYIDGKYTVEHWQEDNTNRTGDATGKIDYSRYDKLSNVESITFYVEGGATAPWITSIKTIPATVEDGDAYRLQIGLDDLEKDELRLITEIYKDKKLIYTHKKSGIVADEKGVYPFILTGFPPEAVPGIYEVVCTVRDELGAGLGTYKFTVVSKGNITGFVNHTEQWNINRKKYNLKRFSDEINRTMSLSDYLAFSRPRPRGTNVFWSGENFILQAETEGKPVCVRAGIYQSDEKGELQYTGYSSDLAKSVGTGGADTELWIGNLWEKTMINKWGMKNPKELIFLFEAEYKDGKVIEYRVPVIIDSEQDYWRLHRLW